MRGSLCLVFSLTLLAALVGLPLSVSGQDAELPDHVFPLVDGRHIHNLTDLFIAYGEAGQDLDAQGREMLWAEMLETPYPDLFNTVIYRGYTGELRHDYRQDCMIRFWTEIWPRTETLRRLANVAPVRAINARNRLFERFPDAVLDCDVYLLVAFSFSGKAVTLNGETVLAMGMERFQPDTDRLDIVLAHEHFHIHHFHHFSPVGELFRIIWAEGMAVVASQEMFPGSSLGDYMGFAPDRMLAIEDRRSDLARFLLARLDSTDLTLRRAFVGMEENSLDLPPGAGYYLGEFIVFTLVREGYGLDELVHWQPDQVRAAMQRILPSLIQE
ncbi:MAG: hypothetical protein D6E12_12070 [Desulfovibrio sp.]|nr:MAG: hypothetical protein D6E12_12070 [Desulfovibrio sp.]